MESKTYIVGRKGDIKIKDSSVSSRHVEVSILGDQIYLTDLESTNGTFLDMKGKKKRFNEGYVELDQVVYLGQHKTTINQLLDLLNFQF